MNGNDQTTPSEWREEMLEGVGTFRFPKATSDAEVKDFFDKKVIPNLPKYLPKGLADVERFDQEIDATQ